MHGSARLLALTTIFAAAPALAEPVSNVPRPTPAEWAAYWNQGKGEITSYALEQARYGERHEGDAVLVFVTEPFSKKKKVKLDDPARAGADAVEVLKLNHTRKFVTGLYPYSTLSSVFTPVRGDRRALKLTATTQEWCGHVFMQLTEDDAGGYSGRLYSYFESEGDRALQTPAGAWLEDDLWTTLRIDPNRLPTGEVQIVPGATFLRLRHQPVQPRAAKASLTRSGDHLVYEVRYTAIDRSLRIEFDRRFPFRILGWSETYPSGWGPGAEPLTTTARRKGELMTDYWNHHGNADRRLRAPLGLP